MSSPPLTMMSFAVDDQDVALLSMLAMSPVRSQPPREASAVSSGSRSVGCGENATDFTIHVESGGLTGVVAPIIGKEPPDYHIWLQSGTPPVFVREEGPLYEGGPVWRSARPSPNNLRPCPLAQIAHLIGALRIADMPCPNLDRKTLRHRITFSVALGHCLRPVKMLVPHAVEIPVLYAGLRKTGVSGAGLQYPSIVHWDGDQISSST
jgi:hypothetical protein